MAPGTAGTDLPGLRERKKARTRASIQGHALRLFAEQGYEQTTVEQICAHAEVSESTFFRYFPTKVDVVVWDEFDPLLIEVYRAQPAELSPVAAFRVAVREVFGKLGEKRLRDQRARFDLALRVPELRAASIDQLALNITMIGEMIAERCGRSAGDPAVRALAGATVGVSMAALFELIERPGAHPADVLDALLAHLEDGLQV